MEVGPMEEILWGKKDLAEEKQNKTKQTNILKEVMN